MTGPKKKWLLPEENVLFLCLTHSSFSVCRRVATKRGERKPVPKIASLFLLDNIVFTRQDWKSTKVPKARVRGFRV